MVTAREVLAEIEQRATVRREFWHRDSVNMVAALRAVLDECDRAKIHTSDGRFIYIPRLESSITDALSGVTTRTDLPGGER